MRRPSLSRDWLSVIAMLTMACDHAGAVFVDPGTWAYVVMREIGRTAYPLFLALFLDGCRRSGSGTWKRMAVMAAAAVAAEPAFDFMVAGTWLHAGYQNVLWSWVLSMAFVAVLRDVTRETLARFLSRVVAASAALLAACAVLRVDYGWMHAACTAAGWLVSVLAGGRDGFLLSAVSSCAILGAATGNPACFLAVPFAWLYDPDEPGRRFLPGGCVAWFYPAHLAAYAAVRFLAGP